MHEKNERVLPSRLQNAVNCDHTKQLLLGLEIFACWTDVKLDTSLYSKAIRLLNRSIAISLLMRCKSDAVMDPDVTLLLRDSTSFILIFFAQN